MTSNVFRCGGFQRKLSLGIIVMILPGLTNFAQAADDAKQKVQINAFFGAVSLAPAGVNQVIDDNNVLATKKVSTLSRMSLLGGELMFALNNWLLIGPRYTFSFATSGKGTRLNQDLEVGTILEDYSLIAKYQMHFGMWALQLGGGIGRTGIFRVANSTFAGAEFNAPPSTIARGLVGVRANWTHFALFAEGGYQSVNGGEFKDGSGNKLQSTRGVVSANYSAPYFLGGLGVQF